MCLISILHVNFKTFDILQKPNKIKTTVLGLLSLYEFIELIVLFEYIFYLILCFKSFQEYFELSENCFYTFI